MKKDPLKIIFEKHLFGGEFLSSEALGSAVLNYYFEYLEQSQMILRVKDMDEIKEEIREEIIELINKTTGLEKNIKNFLKALDNLEEKKVESQEKYIELYIELEEEFGI